MPNTYTIRLEGWGDPPKPKTLKLGKCFLYEYDTGDRFGPASQENIDAYNEAKKAGNDYFMYPYHGYQLRMLVFGL